MQNINITAGKARVVTLFPLNAAGTAPGTLTKTQAAPSWFSNNSGIAAIDNISADGITATIHAVGAAGMVVQIDNHGIAEDGVGFLSSFTVTIIGDLTANFARSFSYSFGPEL